jgi:WD40-like Beta Propeller Repeat
MTDAERNLRLALREHRVPEEREAEERAWRVVSAAAAGGAEPGARRGRTRRRALQALALAGLIALLASPAGASVRHWLADRLTPGVEQAKPVLGSLPGSGSLLVQSREGPWIVHPDGGKRLLGAYSEASWSPHGIYVVATSRHELAAVEPDGTARWTIAGRGPLRLARWNGPDGYRIAYLDGRELRVVDGDGTGNRLIARGVPRVAPAWKAGPAHVLAYAQADGAVAAIAADTRARLFVTGSGAGPVSLQWSSGRLLVTRPDGLQVFDAGGRPLWRWSALRAELVWSATAAPQGSEVAAVVHRGGTSRLLLLGPGRAPRIVFSGPGHFAPPVWSPDGRWLLLPWPSADQWLFLNRRGSSARLHAVANVAAQFAPGTVGAARFPTVSGWCCTR